MTQNPTEKFDEARANFVAAQNRIDAVTEKLEAILNGSEPALEGQTLKIERAIDGLKNQRFFHFRRMSSPDLTTPASLANADVDGVAMDGLNWPEEMRHGIITEAQRAIILRFNSNETMKRYFSAMTEEEKTARSHQFW